MNDEVKDMEKFVLKYNEFKNEIGKVVIGQDAVIKQVLISIFCNGHCLLVGVPGLAKTLLVQTIADALGLNFNRIQFTPDLMPSDIVGAEILDENREFKFIKGPLFSNIILADDINDCKADTSIIGNPEVIINPLPIAVISPPVVIIYDGEQVELSVGDYQSYQWFDSDDLLMENVTSWVTSGFTIRDSFGNHLQTVNGVS